MKINSKRIALSLLVTLLGSLSLQGAGPNAFYGMCVGHDTNITNADPFLHEAGVKTCRLWASYDWTDRSNITNDNKDVFKQARDLKAKGYTVILLIHNKNSGTYSEVKAFFDWAREYKGTTTTPMRSVVDYWEVVNELNLVEYWTGTPSQYVNNVLKGAWDSLNPVGEKVIGGSFTAWQKQTDGTYAWADSVSKADVAQAYVTAGYLKYCHYAGLHPYTDNVTRMKNVITSHKTIFGTKPVIMTEYNFKYTANNTTAQKNSLVTMLNEIRPFLLSNTTIACFYRFTSTNSYYGICNYSGSSYVKNQPFFDMYKAWQK